MGIILAPFLLRGGGLSALKRNNPLLLPFRAVRLALPLYHIVVHLKVHRIVSQKNGTASAKDFNESLVFLWEYGVNNRQQGGLVTDAGDWGSDRLFHAPFIMETAGTVPVVRIPYRPLGFVPAIFSTEMERRLSLNARGFFKCITSFAMC